MPKRRYYYRLFGILVTQVRDKKTVMQDMGIAMTCMKSTIVLS